MMLDDRRAADLFGRAEALLDRVESGADTPLRTDAVELVRALLELYGEGLARLTAVAVRAGGDGTVAELAADGLLRHLLLLHGLHPLDLSTRVAAAVEAVSTRPGAVRPESVSVDGSVVRVRLPAPTGCRSSAAAAGTELVESIRAAAPEIERVDLEESRPAPAVIPVASLFQTPVAGGRR
jgi:hypothetical protein